MKKAEPKAKKPVIKMNVSVNGNQAEPMRLLGNHTDLPETGDVVKVLPDRLKSTVFAKQVKIERISQENGKRTFHATTGF
jgi:hypothetical protein